MGSQVIAVFAGNKQQFDEWVRQQPIEDVTYVYVDREEKVVGYRWTGIELVGTYYENKYFHEMCTDVEHRIKMFQE